MGATGKTNLEGQSFQMKRNMVLVFGVVVLLAASVLVYEIGQSHQPNQIDYASASKVVHSPVRNGLELTATIEQIFIPEGQNLTIVAEVNNTLSTPMKVNSTSIVNPAYGPCQQGFATGIELYSGNYTYMELFNNGSTPTPFLLYDPSLTYTCPAVFTFQYTFEPDSATATINSSLAGHHFRTDTKLVIESSVVGGYYLKTSFGYQFERLPVGEYTVVVFDAWGDRAIGHFQVVS